MGSLTDGLRRSFRILVTGNNSGLVETITDSVSIHSIKKIVYARRLTEGNFRQVTLYDYFTAVSPSSYYRRAITHIGSSRHMEIHLHQSL